MYKNKEEAKMAWEAGIRKDMVLFADGYIRSWVEGICYEDDIKDKSIPSEEVMWKEASEFKADEWKNVMIANFSAIYADHTLRPYTNLEQWEDEPMDEEELEQAKDFLAQYTTEEVERIFKEYAREAFSKAYAERKEAAKVLYPQAKFEA